jgi:hypothetical protein
MLGHKISHQIAVLLVDRFVLNIKFYNRRTLNSLIFINQTWVEKHIIHPEIIYTVLTMYL